MFARLCVLFVLLCALARLAHAGAYTFQVLAPLAPFTFAHQFPSVNDARPGGLCGDAPPG